MSLTFSRTAIAGPRCRMVPGVTEMTKYEEMKEIAATAQRNFHAGREHCLKFGVDLVNGFISYCGIPNGQVKLVRWNAANKETPFEEAEPGSNYTMSGAMQFSEEDQYWHFGVRLALSEGQWIFFGLGVAVRNGKTVVKIGNSKAQDIELTDQSKCNALYDSIVEIVKECYREGNVPPRQIGFSVGA